MSGAAASGTSTVAKSLPSRLENLICQDYDERVATDEYTRCGQLEEWVQLALSYQREGKDFLLTSHSPLGELLACPSARRLTGISACLLDCSDPARIQRMRKRGVDPRWPPSQDVLNWAAWHQMHAWDPQWEQHVIVGNRPPEHSYNCWIHWQQTDERWQVHVIDTTSLEIEQMLDQVVAWVKSERKKIPPLHPTRSGGNEIHASIYPTAAGAPNTIPNISRQFSPTQKNSFPWSVVVTRMTELLIQLQTVVLLVDPGEQRGRMYFSNRPTG